LSKPTNKVLCVRYGVLRWLRFERRCAMVMHERSPWWTGGVPDVIGVTQSAQVIEVEIKISMADFRKDADKYRHRIGRYPWQFYYAVPEVLRDKATAEMQLFPAAGLLSVSKLSIAVLVLRAETNKTAEKLTESQWKRAVDCQANCVVSLTRQLLQSTSTHGRPDLDVDEHGCEGAPMDDHPCEPMPTEEHANPFRA
jgi:hypothetical protein